MNYSNLNVPLNSDYNVRAAIRVKLPGHLRHSIINGWFSPYWSRAKGFYQQQQKKTRCTPVTSVSLDKFVPHLTPIPRFANNLPFWRMPADVPRWRARTSADPNAFIMGQPLDPLTSGNPFMYFWDPHLRTLITRRLYGGDKDRLRSNRSLSGRMENSALKRDTRRNEVFSIGF